MSAVRIVATGVANLASVRAAFARLGLATEVVQDAAAIASAHRLVLPGVGAFAAGMQRLRELELVEALRERVVAGRPTLAICLGMQLCCEGSDESPGVAGLGVVPGRVRRFGDDGSAAVQVPQLGWNRVDNALPDGEAGYAYFANSYRLVEPPPDWQVATAQHGGAFVAALRRAAVWLCQFHPEISGEFGARVLTGWLEQSREEVAC